MAAIFSLVLSEVKSLGEFFKKGLSSKRKSPILDPSFHHPHHLLWDLNLTHECSLYWELPHSLLPIFPLDLFIWRFWKKSVGVGFYKIILYFSKLLITKMMVLSIVWFLWHIPIYQLPWITAGSSNYLIFYLMILGNSFLLGVLKSTSKGAVPCILAHMLIDSLAVLMLVQSSLTQIILLVIFEIMIASWLVAMRKS